MCGGGSVDFSCVLIVFLFLFVMRGAAWSVFYVNMIVVDLTSQSLAFPLCWLEIFPSMRVWWILLIRIVLIVSPLAWWCETCRNLLIQFYLEFRLFCSLYRKLGSRIFKTFRSLLHLLWMTWFVVQSASIDLERDNRRVFLVDFLGNCYKTVGIMGLDC